ncbi:sugar phosphate isomerase/epimerase [Faecalicatena sp. AGMB00832]|uniref:Sugar phosphate isomerase/epimerase n=1 Tax=Faecalicatena faecalis TaxID=2726362 RepID=A0ABS6D3A2_9FIRM|nr:TIM barrel protein [Faecalicatena faecalis]MBU3875971.1 sugar phosphate isomerase/epimerase [Faecalicatena faecalis]
MLGIYDCFGYGAGYDVPFQERYKLIKNAGFDCVMLWWSDKFGRGEGYQEGAQYARDAGLFIENIHTPVHEQNNLSLDNLDGESVFQTYLQCVKDCAKYHIPAMVIHLPGDNYPVNELGMERLKIMIRQAECDNIKVAFENLENVKNLDLVLTNIHSDNAGFCYDSCHHINYAPDFDFLKKYGKRLMTVHLQDNGGRHNQHQLPFDGSIEWTTVMKKIALTGYKGATTLEPMNWDYENLTIQEFLNLAYQKAERLDDMLREN